MNQFLTGRDEILRAERRLFTDTMSSVGKTLNHLEHKYTTMHADGLISNNRLLHYTFDILRLRFSIEYTLMRREKAKECLNAMYDILINTCDPVHSAHYARENYRLTSEMETQADDERMLREALEIFIQHGQFLHAFRCCLTLAQHYQRIDNFEKCLEFVKKSKDLSSQLPNEPFLESQYLLGLSNFHIGVQDFDTGRAYLIECLNKAKSEKNWRTEIVALSNLASTFLMTTKLDVNSALDHLNGCIVLGKKYKANSDLCSAYMKMGSAYTHQKDFAKALLYFREAGKVYEKNPYPLHQATLHYKLARLHMQMNNAGRNTQKIEHHFKQAHDMSFEHGFQQLRVWVLRNWSLWLKSKKQWERAFTLLRESYEVERNLVGKDVLKNIKEIEVKYATSLHEKENEILRKQNHELGRETRNLREKMLERTTSIMKELNRYSELRRNIIGILESHNVSLKAVKEINSLLLPLSITELEQELFFNDFHHTYPEFIQKLELKVPDITLKEKKICILLKSGLNTYQIAVFLDLSPRTVETHRLNIRRKAQLQNDDTIDTLLSSLTL